MFIGTWELGDPLFGFPGLLKIPTKNMLKK